MPRPIVRVPIAIPVADGDPALIESLNTWLRVEKEDRTIQRLYDDWGLGREEKPLEKRWSVIRDVANFDTLARDVARLRRARVHGLPSWLIARPRF